MSKIEKMILQILESKMQTDRNQYSLILLWNKQNVEENEIIIPPIPQRKNLRDEDYISY